MRRGRLGRTRGRALLAVVAMSLAVTAPAAARFPVPVHCSAKATVEVYSSAFAEDFLWRVHNGLGTCAVSGGVGERWSVSFSGDGGPLDSSTELFGFLLDIRLRLTSDLTGDTALRRQTWVGYRLNCTPLGRFGVLSPKGVPLGTGNLKFCGPAGWPGTDPGIFVPASVTMNFVFI